MGELTDIELAMCKLLGARYFTRDDCILPYDATNWVEFWSNEPLYDDECVYISDDAGVKLLGYINPDVYHTNLRCDDCVYVGLDAGKE